MAVRYYACILIFFDLTSSNDYQHHQRFLLLNGAHVYERRLCIQGCGAGSHYPRPILTFPFSSIRQYFKS